MRIGFASDVICAGCFLRSPHSCGTASMAVRETLTRWRIAVCEECRILRTDFPCTVEMMDANSFESSHFSAAFGSKRFSATRSSAFA
jgi:hypothetical protein